MGTYDFEAQYQQRPVPKAGLLIKPAWFGEFPHVPCLPSGGRYVMSWDTAAKTGEHNDYSVCTVWVKSGGAYHLVDVVRCKLEYPDLRRKMIQLSEIRSPGITLIEDAGPGTSLIQDLKRQGLRVIGVKPDRDKVSRIMSHLPLIEAGAIELPSSAPWKGEFLSEMAAFPNGKHDDQGDSVAQYLTWKEEHRRKRVIVRQMRY